MAARAGDQWDRIGRGIARVLRAELGEPRKPDAPEKAPDAVLGATLPGRRNAWLDPWLRPWGDSVGGPPPASRIARMVTELRAADEPMDDVLEAWLHYLAETDSMYVSPQHFQSRWRTWTKAPVDRAAERAQSTARAVAQEIQRRGGS